MATRTVYRCKDNGKFCSKATYNRSHAQSGKSRFVRAEVRVNFARNADGTFKKLASARTVDDYYNDNDYEDYEDVEYDGGADVSGRKSE